MEEELRKNCDSLKETVNQIEEKLAYWGKNGEIKFEQLPIVTLNDAKNDIGQNRPNIHHLMQTIESQRSNRLNLKIDTLSEQFNFLKSQNKIINNEIGQLRNCARKREVGLNQNPETLIHQCFNLTLRFIF